MSLWRMSTAGVAVPNGFILTTTFFEKWFETLKTKPAWQNMLESCSGYDPDDQGKIQALHDACEAAKVASQRLVLDDEQCTAVSNALQGMQTSTQGPMSFVAVRSSSPEEDLAGMSFAGGYETVLGVKAEVAEVQTAVQRVFASCLDERVFVYKMSHNIRDLTPRIACVVQRQVAASVAGVAFSLDPISNCYDWATINTNFGLGESVVSGQCSPDYYLVNKSNLSVIKSELGKKETAVWLGEDGGVHEKAGCSSEWTLTHEEVKTITTQLAALEEFYGFPIDTEFALDERRQVMWLQARPITTHFQLPQTMVTACGSPEMIWLDVMQIVQGFTEPASVAGLSYLDILFSKGVLSSALGLYPEAARIDNRPCWIDAVNGLVCMNGSMILRLMGFNKRGDWADKLELMDFNVAKAIRELEDDNFTAAAAFRPLPLNLLWNCPGILNNIYSSRHDIEGTVRNAKDAHAAIWGVARDLFEITGHRDKCSVQGAYQEWDRSTNTSSWFSGNVYMPETEALLSAHRKKLGAAEGIELHFVDMIEAVIPSVIHALVYGLVSATLAGGLASQNITALFKEAPEGVKAKVDDALQGCTFVTTVLSDLLDEMAYAIQEAGATYTLDELMAEWKNGGKGWPQKVQSIWRTVMDQFGHRGYQELDIKAPRYREDPSMLFEQVVAFSSMDKDMRPLGLAEKARSCKAVAVQELQAWLQQMRGDVSYFQKQMERYHSFFKFRESGKYLVIKILDFARLETLKQADALVQNGKLDAVEDVWLLRLEDLKSVYYDQFVDLQAIVSRHKEARSVNAHVKSWPKCLTSRGRILKPKPRAAKEGEVGGHAVSAGVVRGRIKTLRHPREKPLVTGEILVAKATDPGWTPLFVPAAAILLEVGGALQHGALVAREFGKPCVAGIEDVMEKFRDGQLVEVDGTQGIVKILSEAPDVENLN